MAEESSGKGLRDRARGAGVTKAMRAVAGRLGYDLIRRHYYSPIPDLEALPEDIWTRRGEMPGVRFDIPGSLEFVRKELAEYVAEYAPPRQPTGDPRDFFLDNGLYESVDTELLYAIVRRFQPPRVMELGSGMSTLVIADARERNGQADRGGHVVYDPFMREDLGPAIHRIAEPRLVSATDIPIEDFEQLQAGDLLFVDTTHTVKVGGEVNRIVLEVLPVLAPGVLIHVHDIYLPFEYPREFAVERNFFWAEQYLLQAFLAFNDQFDVMVGANALARLYPAETAELFPSATPGIHPGAFWLRRAG
jgi:hypothetical protein